MITNEFKFHAKQASKQASKQIISSNYFYKMLILPKNSLLTSAITVAFCGWSAYTFAIPDPGSNLANSPEKRDPIGEVQNKRTLPKTSTSDDYMIARSDEWLDAHIVREVDNQGHLIPIMGGALLLTTQMEPIGTSVADGNGHLALGI